MDWPMILSVPIRAIRGSYGRTPTTTMLNTSQIVIAYCLYFLLVAPLAAETVTATGTIESVDAGKRTITVRRKTAKGEKTAKFAVGAKAEIAVEGQPSALTSLKAGQSVTISYDTAAKQITEITVGSASAPSARGDGPDGPPPPDDAIAFEGHSYKFFREVMTWHQAKKRCEQLGGHLAIVGSDPENDFIMALAKSGIGNLGKQNGVWLGATDEDREGDWRWIDGSRFRFTNWCQQPKQPNNAGGDEHYLWMWLAQGGVWTDQADAPKEMTAYFVCEWNTARSRKDRPAAELSLFNGKDLSGWTLKKPRRIGIDDPWLVDRERKVLISPGGNGSNWLESEKSFKNFALKAEYRFPPGGQDAGNGSGIVVRASGLNQTGYDPRGIEIDLHVKVQEQGTGTFRCYECPLKTKRGECPPGQAQAALIPVRHVQKPTGEWNELEIECANDRITVKVNDEVVNEGTGAKIVAGKICLRNQSTTIEFRNLRITPTE